MSDPPEYDVLTIGRSCIDLYAHEIGVPLTGVKSFDAYVGGCPTNISVGTRRLGLRSALLTAVGEDEVVIDRAADRIGLAGRDLELLAGVVALRHDEARDREARRRARHARPRRIPRG